MRMRFIKITNQQIPLTKTLDKLVARLFLYPKFSIISLIIHVWVFIIEILWNRRNFFSAILKVLQNQNKLCSLGYVFGLVYIFTRNFLYFLAATAGIGFKKQDVIERY